LGNPPTVHHQAPVGGGSGNRWSKHYGNCRGKRKPVGFYSELYRNEGGVRRDENWRGRRGGEESRREGR